MSIMFLQKLEVKFIFFYSFHCSLYIEELPIKYNKIFSDLSDVEIPLEMLSIGMELGEGTMNEAINCQVVSYKLI